ncbi:GNAT family N-acetyltransferase/peptidase C39 family protein [Alteromonas sp. a30]|uniref:GNAT family N-acetyltransferase/peptidase C39 family protein n=1 Tax=Alteromonas sp. a30 TaxID=2730917 RepID=UPI00227F50FC|nr:GNAT family N-acetyltransferase [Alteromonas sp. a30]
MSESETNGLVFRQAQSKDLTALVELEGRCFNTDRLSKRQFQHWLKASNKVLLVAENHQGNMLGYGLVIMRKGTRLARLYSLAVDSAARGMGVGRALLEALEDHTLAFNRLFMRLEVASANVAAIRLYESLGYKSFGIYQDYYDDHSDALRMQKSIKQAHANKHLTSYPWYQQTTEFTCGPSSLMMAMASLHNNTPLTQDLELDLWREATTIYMTSGHGGCHPIGLAIAAHKRELHAEVYISQAPPLFANGVRNIHKKQILEVVEQQFVNKAEQAGIPIHYQACELTQIEQALADGGRVLILISTYQFDGKKVPHWVTVTAVDAECIYLHDPDVDPEKESPLDCQHIPIAKQDFLKLSCYGKTRLRSTVILRKLE